MPDADILVVDDSSPDGTGDLARRMGEQLGRITVLQSGSGGEGSDAAYRAGFTAAIAMGADICVEIDADLSHDPAVVPALVANVEHGADLAIGSRYVPGGRTVNWPRRRQALVAMGEPIRRRRARAWRSTMRRQDSGPTPFRP